MYWFFTACTWGRRCTPNFHIADIGQASVTGLSGEEFLDKVDNFACKEQIGPVTFHDETDRVYVNKAHYGIDDPVLKRCIKIHANALNNALTVHAGETHTLVAEYSVEAL